MKFNTLLLVSSLCLFLLSYGKNIPNNQNSSTNNVIFNTNKQSTSTNTVEIKQSVCNQEMAIFIGKLNYYANPMEMFDNYRSIKSYVENNRSHLQPNSQAIRCMREAGEKMIGIGIKTFSQEDGDQAYESALGMGAPMNMANDVRYSVNQGSIDTHTFGLELVWLSQVLPKAAQGDWNDFLNTGTDTRMQIVQSIQLMAPMMDQETIRIYKQTMTQYGPDLVYSMTVMILFTAE